MSATLAASSGGALRLPSHPVYDALARSGVFTLTADSLPDEVSAKLLAVRAEVTGADPVVIALVREHLLRFFRDLSYSDPATLLTATLGRPDAGRRNAVNPLGNGNAYSIRTAADLVADQSLAAETAWIVRGLVVRGGLSVFYGPPKVGKGTLVTYIVRQVAAGERCLGEPVQGGPVLWVDLEQGHRLNRRKFTEADAGSTMHPIHIYAGPVPPLEQVENWLIETGAKLLVIDSLSRFLRLADENSNAEVTAGLAPLVDLAHRLDVGIVLIHHDRKSGGDHGAGLRGASSLLAVVDVAIHVRRESAEDDQARRLVGIGRYDEANTTRIVRRTSTGYDLLGSPADLQRQRIVAVVAEGGTMAAEQIAEHLGVTRPGIVADLQYLVGSGQLHRSGGGKKGDPHRYSSVNAVTDSNSGGVTALQDDPDEQVPACGHPYAGLDGAGGWYYDSEGAVKCGVCHPCPRPTLSGEPGAG
jgi:KaiC/GvpD/RAD55 family RecA-like ATPase